MDIFNKKKIAELEHANFECRQKISDLEYKLSTYDTALKALNKYMTNELEIIQDYLLEYGKQKMLNGKKISCFKLFAEEKNGSL